MIMSENNEKKLSVIKKQLGVTELGVKSWISDSENGNLRVGNNTVKQILLLIGGSSKVGLSYTLFNHELYLLIKYTKMLGKSTITESVLKQFVDIRYS
jgi:hypothetical protein